MIARHGQHGDAGQVQGAPELIQNLHRLGRRHRPVVYVPGQEHRVHGVGRGVIRQIAKECPLLLQHGHLQHKFAQMQIAQMNQPHGLRPPFRSYKYISTKTRHTAGASSSRQASSNHRERRRLLLRFYPFGKGGPP